MSTHRRLGWLSTLCDQYPEHPEFNRALMRAVHLPLIGEYIRKKNIPTEPYVFWDRHCPGFSEPCRDLYKEDVISIHRRIVPQLSAAIPEDYNELLVKITGYPRIGFLRELLPSTRFIQVIRDGRAVVASHLVVGFWRGWNGPTQWRWGELSAESHEIWLQSDKSFVTLAGLQWKMLMNASRKATTALSKDDLLTVTYEELCKSPRTTMEKALVFVGLAGNDRFWNTFNRTRLHNTNDKWHQVLTNPQQKELEQIIGSELAEYGYK